jgi:hypothetical protein
VQGSSSVLCLCIRSFSSCSADVAAFASLASAPAALALVVRNVDVAVRGMDHACAIYLGEVRSRKRECPARPRA